MKTFLLILLLSISSLALADVHVRGHYRSNGTYVQPHYRSSPNGTTLDNFSTKGNVNPYTGKEGTVNSPIYPYSPSISIQTPAVKNLTPVVPSNGSNKFNGIPIYEIGN
jgi:hypothetical protein